MAASPTDSQILSMPSSTSSSLSGPLLEAQLKLKAAEEALEEAKKRLNDTLAEYNRVMGTAGNNRNRNQRGIQRRIDTARTNLDVAMEAWKVAEKAVAAEKQAVAAEKQAVEAEKQRQHELKLAGKS